MRAFVLYLNGRKLGTAGVGDEGVLTATVTWVRRKGEHNRSTRAAGVVEELELSLAGLMTPTDEHVRWRQRSIKVGDEVRIKVVEVTTVDKPGHRKKRDRAQELRQQQTYVREMAKKFGWTLRRSR
jgi:hypothetical protein